MKSTAASKVKLFVSQCLLPLRLQMRGIMMLGCFQLIQGLEHQPPLWQFVLQRVSSYESSYE